MDIFQGVCAIGNSALTYLSLPVEPYSLTNFLGKNVIYKVAKGSRLNLMFISFCFIATSLEASIYLQSLWRIFNAFE